MIDLVTKDARGMTRHVRVGMSGLDLTSAERRVLRNVRYPEFLWYMITWGSGLLFVGFVLALAATGLKIEWIVDAAAFVAMLGLVALVCGVVWLVMRSIDYKLGDEVVAAWFELGRCPACGFHVAGCEAGGDGAVKCPECAATWRLPEESATKNRSLSAPV